LFDISVLGATALLVAKFCLTSQNIQPYSELCTLLAGVPLCCADALPHHFSERGTDCDKFKPTCRKHAVGGRCPEPAMTFLRFPDLKTKGITFTRVHLARLERADKFPKRVALGENSVAWLESEIDTYIADRVAARGAKQSS
jgi:prophage regulatory protein